jgi:mannose-1-phosphate guanylyltransferase/phosphomannomutase
MDEGRLSTTALMDAASEPDVVFARRPPAASFVPRFLPAFDAMAAFVAMLELLATTGQQLSEGRRLRCRAPAWPRSRWPRPWEMKGVVMRLLLEQAEGAVVLIDGVKVVTDDGWVLALPDPEAPVTHIWAEAATDADARRLAQEHARRVRPDAPLTRTVGVDIHWRSRDADGRSGRRRTGRVR